MEQMSVEQGASAIRRGLKKRKKQIASNPTVYSVEELAKEIGISRQMAYAQLRRGTIPHIRMGNRFIIPRAAIQEWLKNAGKSQQDPV